MEVGYGIVSSADPSADDFLAEMLGAQSMTTQARRRRRNGEESPTLEVWQGGGVS